MNAGHGQPDWAAAVSQAQALPPVLDTAALRRAEADRAALIARLAAAHHREA